MCVVFGKGDVLVLSLPEGDWDDKAESEVRRKLGGEDDVRTARESCT